MHKITKTQNLDFVDPKSLQSIVSDMLTLAKSKGADAAEVATSVSQGLTLTVRMQEVETVEFNRNRGISLTVYKGKQKGSASTNDLSQEAIANTIDAALNLAEYTQQDIFSGLAEQETLAQDIVDCDLYHPWHLEPDQAKELARICEASALETDRRIKNSEGSTFNTTENYYIYGNSHGFLAGYPSTRHALSCVVIAEDAQGMQRDYQYTIHRNPSLLKHAKVIGSEAAQRALDRLSSRRVPTQTIPVIFRADVAASLFGHFCSAIAGSKLYRKATFLLDSLNTQIFPSHMEILEEPHLQQALGSAPFDADGVQTRSRYLIKEGILQGYILSAYSARKLNMANTGNAGGIHNLIISHQDLTLEDLINSQKKALFVTELMGQGINLVTGNYSRGAAGFMIEDGKIQYPVQEITIAGNLKDMFKQISTISNDIDRRGNIQTGSVLVEGMMLAGS